MKVRKAKTLENLELMRVCGSEAPHEITEGGEKNVFF